MARALFAMLGSGADAGNGLIKKTIEYVSSLQRSDGGWSDAEETAWSIGAFRLLNGAAPQICTALDWLSRARNPSGGWGRHSRDQSRIPITSLIHALVPEVIRSEDLDWLIEQWSTDFAGPVRLTYKGGFFLLAAKEGMADELVTRTLGYLAEAQNDDGGFAPWKNHPMGSDPWSTGVVLWGLSNWTRVADKALIQKGLSWLEQNQLPSGYWPYHYLDDGSSLALIGAVAAIKALATTE